MELNMNRPPGIKINKNFGVSKRKRRYLNKKNEEHVLQFSVEAIRNTQRMSLIAFFVSVIVSIAIVLATWNAYFSWYSNFALKEEMSQNEMTKIVHAKAIEKWIDSTNISLPFLGILDVKVWIGDCSIFGSIALLIINTLFFLSIRREYYMTGFLLKKIPQKDKENVKYSALVYHGIVSYMLLNIKRKYSSVGDRKKLRQKFLSESIIKVVFKVLLFLPVLSILTLIITELLYVLVFPVLFQFSHPPIFDQIGGVDRVRLIFQEVPAFLLLFPLIILCKKILSYTKGMEKKVRKYAYYLMKRT
jgi:hypothetical protein